MQGPRPLPLLATLLICLLLAPTARADERSCYQVTAIDGAAEHPAGDRLAVPGWDGLWSVNILASTSLLHEARTEPRLEVTLHPDKQAAPVLRTLPGGEPGPMALHAWSRPPDTWCSDGPVPLDLVLDGAGDTLTLSTDPVAALAIGGVTRIDGQVLAVHVPTFGVQTASAQVAPRVDGPPAFTLVVTLAPEPSRPDHVVQVHFHYARAGEADTLVSGAALPPPVALNRPIDPAGSGATADAATEDARPTEAAEGEEEEQDEDSKSYLGDVSSGWFHLGGGGALIRPGNGAFTGGGRFALGFGGYTFFFYGGAGFEADFSPVVPVKAHGVAYLGVHIPIPVVHPLIGVKVAGGMAADPLTGRIGPSLGIGGQAGFIFRAFDGRGGLRFVVEPTFGLTGMGDDVSTFELWFVVAAVF